MKNALINIFFNIPKVGQKLSSETLSEKVAFKDIKYNIYNNLLLGAG